MRRLALLLPVLALSASRQDAFKLENLLPEGTLLFAETPSAAGFRTAFKKTPLYRFFQDEEIVGFGGGAVEAVLRDYEGFAAAFEKELGIPWNKAWELPTGQVAFAMPALVRGDPMQPDLVVSIHAAGKGATLRKAVALARKTWEKQSGKKAVVWRAGADEVVSGEIVSGVPWHLAVLGDTLVAATWEGTMKAIARAHREGQPRPLGRSAKFLQARKKAEAKELFLFADLAGFVAEAKENLGEDERKAVAALGLDGFTYAAGGLAVGEDSVKERFFLATSGERKGLAKFLSLKGAAPGFEAAPQGALQFLSLSIDLPDLYDTALDMVKGADPFQHQQLLDDIDRFEREAGISIRNDLLPAFGPRISSYSALPREGLIPDGVTTLQIKDAARFDKCLKAGVRNLGAELAVIDFRGKKINYLKFSQPAGFDPGRLLLSTLYFIRDGDTVHLSGVGSLAGGFGGANALKRHVLRADKPRLSASPAVRRWLGGKTGGASLVAYLDLERVFTLVYNTIAPFLPFVSGALKMVGVEADLMRLPLGETVGKYLGQTVHRVRVEPDGLRIDGVSASGTTLMTVTYAGAAGVVLLPAIARATEQAKTSACMAMCSQVYFAVFRYQSEKQKLPAKTGAAFLKELVDLGYLDEVPVCPHSGKATYRGPARDPNSMQATDVIFCDGPESHPDGSINVLRKSGSTERLTPDHPGYRKALETTKGN